LHVFVADRLFALYGTQLLGAILLEASRFAFSPIGTTIALHFNDGCQALRGHMDLLIAQFSNG
jgi:hypothetical protein